MKTILRSISSTLLDRVGDTEHTARHSAGSEQVVAIYTGDVTNFSGAMAVTFGATAVTGFNVAAQPCGGVLS